jgi:hypothetical protein
MSINGSMGTAHGQDVNQQHNQRGLCTGSRGRKKIVATTKSILPLRVEYWQFLYTVRLVVFELFFKIVSKKPFDQSFRGVFLNLEPVDAGILELEPVILLAHEAMAFSLDKLHCLCEIYCTR